MGKVSEQDLPVLAGRKPVAELVRLQPGRVHEVLTTGEADAVTGLKERLKGFPVRWTTLSKEALSEICQTTMHQGVAIRLQPQPQVGLAEVIARSLGSRGNGLLVALDQVVDPHNVGAILRAAEAFGADGLIITKDRSSGITETVRRVSRGASELVPVAEVTNLARSLETLKEQGFWIVGTAHDADAQPIFSTDLPHPITLVVGSEGSGLRRLTREHCHMVVSIPMRGVLESLNVSQAAAIGLSEIQRQQQRAKDNRSSGQ